MNTATKCPIKTLGLLLLILGLSGCELNFSLNTIEDLPLLNETDQTEIMMQGMMVGQQAYYQANGYFAASAESLAVDVQLETQDYRYSLVTEGELAQTVVMKAAAKTAELPSYTGVVTVNITEAGAVALANLCKTDYPSTKPPGLSTQVKVGEGLKCPPGSSQVK